MIVASRYAKSLLDLSVEKGQLEAVYADMLQVKDVCENSREFITFLNSPIIKSDKKIATASFSSLFDNGCSIGYCCIFLGR